MQKCHSASLWLLFVMAAGLAPAASAAQLGSEIGLRSLSVESPVENLSVGAGVWVAGSLQDLQASDDSSIDIDATAGAVEFVATGTAATIQPLSLTFTLEAGLGGSASAAQQSIALRDFSTMAFVPVSSRLLSPGSDVVTRVLAPGDPTRFVQSGTRRTEARVTYQWLSSAGQPLVAIDQMKWQAHVPSNLRTIDFRGYNAPTLNTSANWIRTVFDLDPPSMVGTPTGVQLAFDVTDPGPFNYTFRSELRETNNVTFPVPGTTQVYSMRFDIDELPDLYGPVTIFQRFSVTNNGPDIEVELTGANQFFDAVPNDLQVVAFGDRLRIGKFLQPKNHLAVAIYNGVQGAYRVSLNGEVLHEETGLDTRASNQGSWTQFGLYPHGLHDAQNRADQINTGFTRAAFRYASFHKLHAQGELDLSTILTSDPN